MVSGRCYVVNSGRPALSAEELVASLSGEPLGYTFSDYEQLSEELYVLGMTLADLSVELGVAASTVYSWRRWGIPKPIKAYMKMKLAYEDKVNPEKLIRLA